MSFKALLYLLTGLWWNAVGYHLAKRCVQNAGLDMLALGVAAVLAFTVSAIVLVLLLGANGNQLAKSAALWHVCALVLTTVMGLAIYGEPPTPQTGLGVAFGCVSVFLLSI